MLESGRLRLHLSDADATLRLGRELARALPPIAPGAPCRTLLLYGDLGAGKTTLVRALVEQLPGGEEAEVSSPSFNLYNLYPTTPETAHFDLYRLEDDSMDDALLETWENGGSLVLVEWAERLPGDELPRARLEVRLSVDGTGRRADIRVFGGEEQWLETLCKAACNDM